MISAVDVRQYGSHRLQYVCMLSGKPKQQQAATCYTLQAKRVK